MEVGENLKIRKRETSRQDYDQLLGSGSFRVPNQQDYASDEDKPKHSFLFPKPSRSGGFHLTKPGKCCHCSFRRVLILFVLLFTSVVLGTLIYRNNPGLIREKVFNLVSLFKPTTIGPGASTKTVHTDGYTTEDTRIQEQNSPSSNDNTVDLLTTSNEPLDEDEQASMNHRAPVNTVKTTAKSKRKSSLNQETSHQALNGEYATSEDEEMTSTNPPLRRMNNKVNKNKSQKKMKKKVSQERTSHDLEEKKNKARGNIHGDEDYLLNGRNKQRKQSNHEAKYKHKHGAPSAPTYHPVTAPHNHLKPKQNGQRSTFRQRISKMLRKTKQYAASIINTPIITREKQSDILNQWIQLAKYQDRKTKPFDVLLFSTHPTFDVPIHLKPNTRVLEGVATDFNVVLTFAYLGFVEKIVWVRSPISDNTQFNLPLGTRLFSIGNIGKSDQIAVDDLAISQSLLNYAPTNELTNARQIQLVIIDYSLRSPKKLGKSLERVLGNNPIIVNFDLNFFISHHPYTKLLLASNHAELQTLLQLVLPTKYCITNNKTDYYEIAKSLRALDKFSEDYYTLRDKQPINETNYLALTKGLTPLWCSGTKNAEAYLLYLKKLMTEDTIFSKGNIVRTLYQFGSIPPSTEKVRTQELEQLAVSVGWFLRSIYGLLGIRPEIISISRSVSTGLVPEKRWPHAEEMLYEALISAFEGAPPRILSRRTLPKLQRDKILSNSHSKGLRKRPKSGLADLPPTLSESDPIYNSLRDGKRRESNRDEYGDYKDLPRIERKKQTTTKNHDLNNNEKGNVGLNNEAPPITVHQSSHSTRQQPTGEKRDTDSNEEHQQAPSPQQSIQPKLNISTQSPINERPQIVQPEQTPSQQAPSSTMDTTTTSNIPKEDSVKPIVSRTPHSETTIAGTEQKKPEQEAISIVQQQSPSPRKEAQHKIKPQKMRQKRRPKSPRYPVELDDYLNDSEMDEDDWDDDTLYKQQRIAQRANLPKVNKQPPTLVKPIPSPRPRRVRRELDSLHEEADEDQLAPIRRRKQKVPMMAPEKGITNELLNPHGRRLQRPVDRLDTNNLRNNDPKNQKEIPTQVMKTDALSKKQKRATNSTSHEMIDPEELPPTVRRRRANRKPSHHDTADMIERELLQYEQMRHKGNDARKRRDNIHSSYDEGAPSNMDNTLPEKKIGNKRPLIDHNTQNIANKPKIKRNAQNLMDDRRRLQDKTNDNEIQKLRKQSQLTDKRRYREDLLEEQKKEVKKTSRKGEASLDNKKRRKVRDTTDTQRREEPPVYKKRKQSQDNMRVAGNFKDKLDTENQTTTNQQHLIRDKKKREPSLVQEEETTTTQDAKKRDIPTNDMLDDKNTRKRKTHRVLQEPLGRNGKENPQSEDQFAENSATKLRKRRRRDFLSEDDSHFHRKKGAAPPKRHNDRGIDDFGPLSGREMMRDDEYLDNQLFLDE